MKTPKLLKEASRRIVAGFIFVCIPLVGSAVSCGGSDGIEYDFDDIRLSVNNKYAAIGEVISFTAVDVPDGVTAAWDFGDGTEGLSGISVTHVFEKEGTFTISLDVSVGGQSKELNARVKVEGLGLTRALAGFDKSKMWIMAHRASTGDETIPENSIKAIEKCISSGAVDVIEIDPRTTKDGKIVIMHDDTIDRTTNGTGKVSDLTYAQIQQYFLKLPNGTVTTQKVPTLEEALLAGRGKVYFDLDSKTDGSKMYAVVDGCGMRDRTLFYSGGDVNLGQRLLAMYGGAHVYPFYSSEANISYLYSYARPFMTQINYSHAIAGKPAEIVAKGDFLVSVNHLDVTDGSVDSNMNNGNYKTIDDLISAGNVHMIQTDYPQKLHDYLVVKGKRK